MSIDTRDDLKGFHQFVGEQLANGGAHLAPAEVLAMWCEHVKTVEAVREGLEAVDDGRTKPLDEFARDFERRHRISGEE